MQIQDSSSSTINDDRRKTSPDGRRIALAAGNNKSDAFAELFQFIANTKVARDKPQAGASNAAAAKPAKSSSDPVADSAALGDDKDDEAVDELEGNQATLSVQAIASLGAAVAVTPSDQPSPDAEPQADATVLAATTALATASQSEDVVVGQQVDQTVQEDTVGLGEPLADGERVSPRDKASHHQDQRQESGQGTSSLRADLKPSQPGNSKSNTVDKTVATGKQDERTEQKIASVAESGVPSNQPASSDDRRRDRSEMLRDRLTGDDPSSQAVVTPPEASTSGDIAIDPSLVTAPVVTPSSSPAPTDAQLLGSVAAVAATAAVSSSSVVTASSSESNAIDKTLATGAVSNRGSFDSPDEAASASTMEKASKSRQSELADRARLIHRISKAFQKLGIDGGQVRLKMHPDDLGTVQLDMKVTGNKVSASVTAESEAAAKLLQEHLPDLRQRLESQGLVVDRLQVEQRADSGSFSFTNQQSFQEQSAAYEEASRRQNQRNNDLTRSLGRSSTFANSARESRPIVSRSLGVSASGLDINF